MKLLQFLQYAYLVFAVLFVYDAISNWNVKSPYISLGFAALAVFMFFFRKKFRKRFQDRGKL